LRKHVAVAGEFATAIISMLLFLVIIVAVSVIIKKYFKNGVFFGKPIGQEKNIKLIERCPISQSQSLVIVEVANQTMLLGITNNSIEKIADIDPKNLKEIKEISFKKIFEQSKGRNDEDVEKTNS
jgi:flagellar biosynthetic protein FliO